MRRRIRSFAESERDMPEKPAPATATLLENDMSKYTAEQVLYAAQLEEDTHDGDLIIVQYLRDYAALLRERESTKAGVTDEMVSIAVHAYDSASPSFHTSNKAMRAALEAVAPMLASESSEELKEWEEFGRQIEKRLRYNTWRFKGSYPEIIDRIIKLASTRVPSKMGTCGGIVDEQYVDGWNACRDAMLAAAPKSETEE